jgi:hypothetical protein
LIYEFNHYPYHMKDPELWLALGSPSTPRLLYHLPLSILPTKEQYSQCDADWQFQVIPVRKAKVSALSR